MSYFEDTYIAATNVARLCTVIRLLRGVTFFEERSDKRVAKASEIVAKLIATAERELDRLGDLEDTP